jgi:hypothetical protein
MKSHHWLWIIGGVVVLYIVYAEFLKGSSTLGSLMGSSGSATS